LVRFWLKENSNHSASQNDSGIISIMDIKILKTRLTNTQFFFQVMPFVMS